MQLAARTGAWSGAKLPYDAEVEWIKGNGNEYIELGLNAGNIVGVRAICKFVLPDKLLLGVNENGVRYYLPYVYDVGKVSFGWNDFLTKDLIIDQNVFHEVSLNYKNDRRATIDETVLMSNLGKLNFTTSSNTLKAFCLYSMGSIKPREGYIKEIEITVENETRLSICAVRFTNENGVSEGAMYDRVSGQLFRNAGTGAFIIGPDKT